MDRFKAMQIFVRIVEADSFTRAAETLGLQRASLTATMQNLEAYLGTQLLQRTTRSISLTSDGAEFYARCVEILAAVDAAEGPFRGGGDATQGRLRIELPGALGRRVVVPRLADFHARHPGVELVVGLSDRLADLTRDGIDCALRVGELEDSSLIARPIGSMRFVTCAAPGYLARHGTPQHIDDLSRHLGIVHFSGRSGRPFDWDFMVDGRAERRRVPGTIAVNDADAYVSCGLQGLGLIQAATYMVDEHLARGTLVQVLADWPSVPMPVSLVYPKGRLAAPRLRVFAQWIEALFAQQAFLCRPSTPMENR
ncbi:LysR family transcriptional regulator [Massilia sp. Leaf139]|uniref:LysR family transcriptional regulator n=1 Tax=Massilia sp. Leaf139 TaxID=1736272 RepID=UPI0006FAD084|nr:LysR family transcriptional regulator [Massilia sp. Leaf139]KQQ97274.1 transcriptional regulator [Massilia sp. Leaf139]